MNGNTMNRQQVDEWADENEIDLLVLDGFDDAIVGIGQQFNRHFVIYSQAQIVATLMEQYQGDGNTYLEAIEYFDFNILGAWVGDATPVILLDDAPIESAREQRGVNNLGVNDGR